ncbi:tetratricopeptide repeat protein [Methylophilus sp. 5]|uniref:tetratricopeptide repeat protein n=1 Tax=Methylophilus sp. 5 TaxID=1112274 RepID=UPI00048A6CEB|nr:tetratricopeptide repeat protein [Methylophilus sp. 5]
MKKIIILFLVFLTIFPLITISTTTNNIQEKIEYETFKAKTEANLESLKTLKTQELIQLQAQIDNQKTLLEQVNHQIGSFGNNLSIGSTIITVLLLLIGFFSYRNAKTDAQLAAKQEAQIVTQQEVKIWFDKNTKDLNGEIDILRNKLKILEDEVTKAAISTKELFNKHLNDVLSRSISELDSQSKTISSEEELALSAKLDELKSIAEAMYRFQDWNTKAFASYHQKDFKNAAKFWDLASQSSDASEEQIAQSYFNHGVVLLEQLKGYADAIAIYDKLISRFDSSENSAVQEHLARAYCNKGFGLGKLNEPEKEIAIYDSLINKFGNSKNPEIQTQVARAYLNKGSSLNNSHNQPEAAILTYDTLIQKFIESSYPSIQAQVARAYLNKGVVLGQLSRPEEEIASYELSITKFGNSEHPEVQEYVARAYGNKGVTLSRFLNNPKSAIDTLSSAINKFEKSTNPQLQEQVVTAYRNIAYTQGNVLNQREEEIASYDTIIEKFANSEYPEVLAHVANAYRSKSHVQKEYLHQPQLSSETLSNLIEKFSNYKYPIVLTEVAKAYNSKGFDDLLLAKQEWKEKSKREAILIKAFSSFELGIEICDDNSKPFILGNIAYCNWLLNRKRDVEKLLTEAFLLGGDPLYQATIKDTEQYTVAPDRTFRKLINKVWQSINQHS